MPAERRIEAGNRHANATTGRDEAEILFGGAKVSGYGRFGSKVAVSPT